jgi:hypothetical protein
MVNESTNLTSATRNKRTKKRNHYVYKCEQKIGTDDQRPKGRKLTQTCGEICVYSSPKPLRWFNENTNKWERLQGSCKNHPETKTGRMKQRLNEDKMLIFTYSTKQLALKKALEWKAGKMPIHPQDEPQGLTLPSIEYPSHIEGYFNHEPAPIHPNDEDDSWRYDTHGLI